MYELYNLCVVKFKKKKNESKHVFGSFFHLPLENYELYVRAIEEMEPRKTFTTSKGKRLLPCEGFVASSEERQVRQSLFQLILNKLFCVWWMKFRLIYKCSL